MLPQVPEQHYRLLLVCRGTAEPEEPFSQRIWRLQEQLAELLPGYAVLYGEDSIFRASRITSADAIAQLLPGCALIREEERPPNSPTHRLWLGSPMAEDDYADMLLARNTDAGEADAGLVIQARLGLAVEQADEPAEVLQSMFTLFVQSFEPQWAVLETPQWPHPSYLGAYAPRVGWLSYLSGQWSTRHRSDSSEVTVLPIHDAGTCLRALPKPCHGGEAAMKEAVANVHQWLIHAHPPITESGAAKASAPKAAPQPSPSAQPQPPRQVPPRPRSLEPSAALGRTAAATGPSAKPALPFRGGAASVKPIAASLEPHPEMGSTAALGGTTAIENPEQQDAPMLTLEVYASLTATCLEQPGESTAIQARFGLANPATMAQLEKKFRKLFARQPGEHGRYLGLVQKYRQWMRNQ